MAFLLYPGEEGEITALLDILETQHEERQAARMREIEERRSSGAPLDDDADWTQLADAALKLQRAVEQRDSPAARQLAEQVLAGTAGALVPLGPFRRDPELEHVLVRFRVLPERRRRALQAAEAKAYQALAKAFEDDDPVASAAATDELFDARGRLIMESLVEGFIGESATAIIQEGAVRIDLLERNRLLTPIAQAASAFQELGPGKATRSGSPLGSTSGASPAPNAPSPAGASAAATATAPASPSSSSARDGRPTPAHGGS